MTDQEQPGTDEDTVQAEQHNHGTTPQSVLLLLTSRHGSCEAVRAIVAKSPRWVIVGDAQHIDMAESIARRTEPVLILVATEQADGPLVETVSLLRRASSESGVVIFSETTEGLRQQELVDKGALVRILWRDVDAARLEPALELAARGMRAESAEIQATDVYGRRASKDQRQAPALTDRQKAVLAGLRRGRTQHQLAGESPYSLRTIENIVSELKAAFGAGTVPELIDLTRDIPLDEPPIQD